jgi:hypothetical protein
MRDRRPERDLFAPTDLLDPPRLYAARLLPHGAGTREPREDHPAEGGDRTLRFF